MSVVVGSKKTLDNVVFVSSQLISSIVVFFRFAHQVCTVHSSPSLSFAFSFSLTFSHRYTFTTLCVCLYVCLSVCHTLMYNHIILSFGMMCFQYLSVHVIVFYRELRFWYVCPPVRPSVLLSVVFMYMFLSICLCISVCVSAWVCLSVCMCDISDRYWTFRTKSCQGWQTLRCWAKSPFSLKSNKRSTLHGNTSP